jgi:hypothetical protein
MIFNATYYIINVEYCPDWHPLVLFEKGCWGACAAWKHVTSLYPYMRCIHWLEKYAIKALFQVSIYIYVRWLVFIALNRTSSTSDGLPSDIVVPVNSQLGVCTRYQYEKLLRDFT